jgi:hypothetical protein
VGGRGEPVLLEALAGETRRHDDGVGRLEHVADPPAVHPRGDARRVEVNVVEQVLGLDVEGRHQRHAHLHGQLRGREPQVERELNVHQSTLAKTGSSRSRDGQPKVMRFSRIARIGI